MSACTDVHTQQCLHSPAAAPCCCSRWLVQVVRALVSAGADVDLPDKSSSMTPLHYGAMGGHLDIIDCLIGRMQSASLTA